MSSDKNPEVVGCDASIMKNVWEIREREYGQKMQIEQERIQRSALTSINKDWENRLAVRMGKGTRVERKPKPVENQTDSNNVWKSKQPMAPPTLPRGVGSGPLGGPGAQRRVVPTTAPNYKEKKVQDKNLNRLQLLMFIAQTNPSAMVWGKSWKYNKSLPSPEEGAALDWGKCWMFATQQPYSEPGQPWLNGPNLLDPNSFHLWKKPDYREVESQQLDLDLPSEEWQMSWIKYDKNNKKGDTSSMNEEKSRFFSFMVETQHRNETLCSSEWSESWRSTKPGSQQDNFTVPTEGLMDESIPNKRHKDGEMVSKWEECWRLVNHHGGNKSKLPQVQKSYTPEWVDSWRAAMVAFNNHKNSDSSVRQDHSNTYDDHGQQKESDLYKIMLVSKKYSDLYLQIYNEFNALSEWSKSWQLIKNNSKPCEDIEKILKISPSRMETALEANSVEQKAKQHHLTSEKTDPRYEQLKHDVIYHPRREFTQSNLLHLMHLKNVLSASEWRDSWKTLKHRMRMERRRMRPDPSRPFKDSEKEGDMKPSVSEWKDSWKFTCQPLQQEPELWQQGWPTIPQIRVDRARDENHFAPVQLPKNGPQSEWSWAESWRFSRPQHGSQPGQGRVQTSQGRSSVASNYPDNSQTQRSVRHTGHARSVSDWQEAWMVSETQFHHDKPSLTQWRHAWKSVFNTEHWAEQLSRENEMHVLMESQPQRERMSLVRTKAKMSQSFDNQIFRERYPEKQWSTSWRAGSLLNNQPSQYSSSGIPEKSMSSSNQQQHVADNGHGSKWGLSFRIANPMPHMERPWVESSPNPCHYKVMWSRGINFQNNVNTNLLQQCNNAATFRLWGNSYQFLQGGSAQIKDKTKSKEPVDPRVIMMKKIRTKKHLYSDIEKEKQSGNKWPGCHLLSKTQPRPKRDSASVKKLNMEDENKDKFFEEWAESWRSFIRPGHQKQLPVKSLSGWNDSWKFLIPLYQPMNGPKAK